MFIFCYCELYNGNTGAVDLQTSHGLSDMSVRMCGFVTASVNMLVCQGKQSHG